MDQSLSFCFISPSYLNKQRHVYKFGSIKDTFSGRADVFFLYTRCNTIAALLVMQEKLPRGSESNVLTAVCVFLFRVFLTLMTELDHSQESKDAPSNAW